MIFYDDIAFDVSSTFLLLASTNIKINKILYYMLLRYIVNHDAENFIDKLEELSLPSEKSKYNKKKQKKRNCTTVVNSS